jgi:inactive STAND
MSWTDFLDEIVERRGCEFSREAGKRFKAIFKPEESAGYLETQELLAPQFGYEPQRFRDHLREIYPILRPLSDEREFQAILQQPSGKPKGGKTKLYRLHVWLRQLYEAEQQVLVRQQAVSAPVLTIENALHEQLKEFNYFRQQGQFCEVVNQERCSAFLVRVDGEATQTWLVRRLAEKIPNFLGSKRIMIDVRNQYISADLFTELAQAILGERSGNEPDEIIAEIAIFCKTRNITIALYGVEALESSNWESLGNFWDRLVKAVDCGKCTLLLTEGVAFERPIVMPLSALCELEAWKDVSPGLWGNWTGREEVQNLWGTCQKKDPTQAFTGKSPPNPEQALKQICKEFSVKGRVIDIMTDKIWNLAA